MESKSKFTTRHRLLHWGIAIGVSILFITGFLRMEWMNKDHIVSIISSQTQTNQLSEDQMVTIAKSIRAPMWQWHVYIAHFIFLAFAARLIYMAVKGIRFPNPFNKNLSLKERFQGSVYIYFYLFLTVAAVTGFYLKWIDGSWKHTMETIHKLNLYWFPIFILLHLGGIVLGELTDKKGIASKMIGGE